MTHHDPEAAQAAKALLDEFRNESGAIWVPRQRADNLEIRIGQLIAEAKDAMCQARLAV